jgi:hypothetical protein
VAGVLFVAPAAIPYLVQTPDNPRGPAVDDQGGRWIMLIVTIASATSTGPPVRLLAGQPVQTAHHRAGWPIGVFCC